MKTYAVGTHQKHLSEATTYVLSGEIRKYQYNVLYSWKKELW